MSEAQYLDRYCLHSLVWIICAGHARVQGNERADRLPSTVPVTRTNTIDDREMVKNVYERMLVYDTTQQNQ